MRRDLAAKFRAQAAYKAQQEGTGEYVGLSREELLKAARKAGLKGIGPSWKKETIIRKLKEIDNAKAQ